MTSTQSQDSLQPIEINGETFFKIENSDRLRPFFMSIVSASNHWMFIGSNGGLTAGRKNAEFALFPYYSDDKIVESTEVTGPKTVVQLNQNGILINWEPFSQFGKEKFNISRNLYKNEYGNKVAFEEVNHDLRLTFRYEWSSADKYGFIKKASLTNNGDTRNIRLLDGLQNIIPYGVGSDLQMKQSNLVDAYKRNELDPASGLGIFALSAIIVDRAEPSEALKANVVWQKGLENAKVLVTSKQIPAFKAGEATTQETDVKAEKGAYLVESTFDLGSNASQDWIIVADVNKNHPTVANIIQDISTAGIEERVNADIEENTKELVRLTAAADGLQKSSDTLKNVRHFANVMFNIMRGGIFDNNYQIEKWDVLKYLESANKEVFAKHKSAVDALADEFTLSELQKVVNDSKDASLTRLLSEYLPLKFSRRHGDPSRPWNKFSINTRNEDTGEKILDYQGNWRDIFQNWEALAFAYPQFMEGMIFRFLNASTFDGYNPYRVMKHGFDWETIEPDDPWSYIGYWGDHQIIYLLKFLEFIEKHQPGRLQALFAQETFTYAAVPYKIKGYEDILKNTKDTIIFDHEWDAQIRAARDANGSDGAMLTDKNGGVYHVNFIEKILATTLAKISNLIPDAGIWMNTQRPEWNDANNALVGNGVSMVTLYYLRRFLAFFNKVLATTDKQELSISTELYDCFSAINAALEEHKDKLESGFSKTDRKAFMDALGAAATTFRDAIYDNGFSGSKSTLSTEYLDAFYRLSNQYLEASIESNERADKLYHAYNIVDLEENEAGVSYLDEMLEGQVGVLSSGYLNADQVLGLMDAMKTSAIYREDQNSYILYPNKELKGFLDRNQVPAKEVDASALLKQLVADGDVTVIEKDVAGVYHFHGAIRNSFELDNALNKLDSKYTELVEQDRAAIQAIYEGVFNHKTFTGRSGTFYGYEGLGSIYWHMVSKLLLAVEECTLEAIDAGVSIDTISGLKAHCHDVFEGIGVHKSPDVYGAFSVDPYSHTPYYKGAQQPGMTGQVKEDVISRIIELGVDVNDGSISFSPAILDKSEFIAEAIDFEYVDLNGSFKKISVPANSLVFTYCQVPVIYTLADENSISATMTSGDKETISGSICSAALSQMLFKRSGEVEKLEVSLNM